jgi:hypothetical protein
MSIRGNYPEYDNEFAAVGYLPFFTSHLLPPPLTPGPVEGRGKRSGVKDEATGVVRSDPVPGSKEGRLERPPEYWNRPASPFRDHLGLAPQPQEQHVRRHSSAPPSPHSKTSPPLDGASRTSRQRFGVRLWAPALYRFRLPNRRSSSAPPPPALSSAHHSRHPTPHTLNTLNINILQQ